MPRSLLLACALLTAFLIAGTSPVRAQGFGVYEQGTCAMGRAGTGVAAPCGDGSSIFYNPAGLAGQPGFSGSLGATLVTVQGGFTDDQTGTETALDNEPIPVPHLYANYGVNERLSVGLGAYMPYGLGTTWPTENFEGRFLGYDNQLQSIYVQPTAAYQLIPDRLSVGAGLTVVFGSVELNRRVDLAEQIVTNPATGDPVIGPDGEPATFARFGIEQGTDFADASLQGSGTGVGGHFGARFRVNEWLSVGARYLTSVTIDYEGDASFEQVNTNITLPEGNPLGQDSPDDADDLAEPVELDPLLATQFQGGGTLTTQTVETQITQPAQFVAGISAQATPSLQLLFDYTWTGWTSFDRLELDFENDALDQEQIENYGNTSAFRFGAEYAFLGDSGFSDGLTLRGGYTYNTSAAPEETVTPLLPESDRNQFTVGLGYQFTPGFGVDLSYQYLDQNDRRGRVRELPENFTEADVAATNSGLYTFSGHLLGATLTLDL